MPAVINGFINMRINIHEDGLALRNKTRNKNSPAETRSGQDSSAVIGLYAISSLAPSKTRPHWWHGVGNFPSAKPNGVKSRARRQQPAGTLGMRSFTQPFSKSRLHMEMK